MTTGVTHPKILTVSQVDDWIAAERVAGRTIGFTCGAFDVMHAGHAQYLAAAKGVCDNLLVAVNSDDSIRRYKNPLRPINPWNERAFVLASMASVNRVTILEEDRPLQLILRWKPEFYIKGGDYKTSVLRSASAVEDYGGTTVVIPPEFSSSTSAMFDRIHALAVHAAPMGSTPREVTGLVLLDRDGTLVRDACFDPTNIELLPDVVEALLGLQESGFRLSIITNQQGIGLGYFGYREFIDGNRALLRQLGAAGITISRIYFCPHSLGEQCDCRKPNPGLILRACREEDVPVERCFVVGDSFSDVEAAHAAGCHGFFVGPFSKRYPTMTILDVVRDIQQAAIMTMR